MSISPERGTLGLVRIMSGSGFRSSELDPFERVAGAMSDATGSGEAIIFTFWLRDLAHFTLAQRICTQQKISVLARFSANRLQGEDWCTRREFTHDPLAAWDKHPHDS